MSTPLPPLNTAPRPSEGASDDAITRQALARPKTITIGAGPSAWAKSLPTLGTNFVNDYAGQPQDGPILQATRPLGAPESPKSTLTLPPQEGSNGSLPITADARAVNVISSASQANAPSDRLVIQASAQPIRPNGICGGQDPSWEYSYDIQGENRSSPLTRHRSLLHSIPRTAGGSAERTEKERRVHNILPPFISPVDTPRDRPSTPYGIEFPRMEDSDRGRQEPGKNKNQPWQDGHRGEKAWSIGDERDDSRGRDQQGAVEKSIAATLANTETNSRTRKTSHSLGLFKENAPPHEHRKRESRRDRAAREPVVEVRGSRQGESGDAMVDGGETPIAAKTPRSTKKVEGLEGSHAEKLALALQPTADQQRLQTDDGAFDEQVEKPKANSPHVNDSFPLTDASYAPYSKPPLSKPADHQSYAPDATSASDLEPLQTKTLHQQTHNYLHVSPGSGRETFPPKSISSKSSGNDIRETSHFKGLGSKPHQTVQHSKSNTVAEESLPETSPPHIGDEEDESEHDEVTGALYFPHQVSSWGPLGGTIPSEESSPEILQDKLSHVENGDASSRQRPQKREEGATVGEVDISFQTEDEKSHLHGDIRPPKTPLSDSERTYLSTSEKGYSSTSESEYESWDEGVGRIGEESSLTDDADTTPTATPKVHTPIRRHKHHRPHQHRYHHEAPTPVGAVELKPYKHQVGGHTTVFRFSRRAVCKSLSNRENEFYETVERRHRELLPFLPRYVSSIITILRKLSKAEF